MSWAWVKFTITKERGVRIDEDPSDILLFVADTVATFF